MLQSSPDPSVASDATDNPSLNNSSTERRQSPPPQAGHSQPDFCTEPFISIRMLMTSKVCVHVCMIMVQWFYLCISSEQLAWALGLCLWTPGAICGIHMGLCLLLGINGLISGCITFEWVGITFRSCHTSNALYHGTCWLMFSFIAILILWLMDCYACTPTRIWSTVLWNYTWPVVLEHRWTRPEKRCSVVVGLDVTCTFWARHGEVLVGQGVTSYC